MDDTIKGRVVFGPFKHNTSSQEYYMRSVLRRIEVCIEADMPLHGDDITLGNLRALGRYLNEAEGGFVTPFLFCDADQRQRVSRLVAWVPARQFATDTIRRRDWGAVEQFRFLWKPDNRTEGT